jgi:phosphatidylinositol alpha-mannosyltransferase
MAARTGPPPERPPIGAPLPGLAGTPFCGGATRAYRWPREVAMFLGAYLAYSLARGISRGSDIEAVQNAARVVRLQADLGLNVERQVQAWLTDLRLTAVFGILYLVAQLVAVPLALVVVYRLRRSAYPLLRTTLLGAWLIAIPIYALFPTAPPRLAGIGIVDSVTRESLVPLDAPLVGYFYNPVAAVPSLHAAFAVAIGIGLATVTTNRLLRAAALAWGPLVILVVVATGNHFVFDVLAGLVVVGIAFLIAMLLHGSPFRRAAGTVPVAPAAAGPGAPARTLRIALMLPYAWDTHGGVAGQVRDLAHSLRARGHEVDVLAPADGPVDDPGFLSLGPTKPVEGNGAIGRVALGPRASLRAVRLIRRGGYDVVHLHEPLIPPCLTVLLLSRKPVVGTFHMYFPDSRLYAALAPLGRIAVRAMHHRTAVSEAARASASKFLGGDFEVVPNGITRHVPGAGGRAADDDDEVRVLFVGRNDPRKGLAVLLRAMDRLPPMRLDLVGVDRDELETLAAEVLPGRPVRPTIHAHGRVPEQQRSEMLDAADIMCAPSLEGESFGLVLVEAQSAGLPVVASAIPGYIDVLSGYGRMVPPGDDEALAAALQTLAANPALRRALGARGRLAARRFEWERVTPRFEATYERAIARRHRRRLPAPPSPVAVAAASASPAPADSRVPEDATT